ncbi:hypothetical protein MLD38_016091 [Melastoma candidum]|uniref:Uncharacterized protein n=1 Tax=Melastoma candidum TaxID=119954 RepID=A0ACB9RRS2_9MYRT|nr:hypothetical protein MLD38_016091 [Melastoma candidum]
METQTLLLKGRDGISSTHVPVRQLLAMTWWAPSFNGDSTSHLSSPHVANWSDGSGGHLGDAKQGRGTAGQYLEKGVITRFPIVPESSKSSGDAQKSPVATSPQSECTGLDLGFSPPTAYEDQLHGLFPSSGPHIPDRMMLPLNLTPDEGPIYVNAKQYHGILRRRKSRARAEGENKATRGRKPYMHVSRHLHAMRRPRGSGGRFLNTRNPNNVDGGVGMKKDGVTAVTQPDGSPISDVLQSNSRPSISPKETNGSIGIASGSKVTGMFTQPGLDRFPIIHQRRPLPIYSFPGMTEKTAQSIVMQSKWVAAADNCCNLKF